ncbi:MAG TPA: LPS export ABC transporter periplasmic protein LptC [Bauldia sp.]|nr:LPS export ABC transporter periplasmic protein LptC [Bauldia sp.]
MAVVNEDRYADDDGAGAPPRAPRLRYTPPQPRGEEAYERARRHSGTVRRLRIILPAIAVVAVVAFWMTLKVVPGDLASLIAVAGIDTKTNSVVMQAPHISGFEGTRRAYELKAAKATQSLSDPKVVTFTTITGHIGMDDGGTATVNAGVGTFNGHNNTLEVHDGVTLETTDGASGHLEDAAINLDEGTMTSSKPLDFKMALGSIHANAIQVSERGKHLLFTNGVSVTYLPAGDLMTKHNPSTAEDN